MFVQAEFIQKYCIVTCLYSNWNQSHHRSPYIGFLKQLLHSLKKSTFENSHFYILVFIKLETGIFSEEISYKPENFTRLVYRFESILSIVGRIEGSAKSSPNRVLFALLGNRKIVTLSDCGGPLAIDLRY